MEFLVIWLLFGICAAIVASNRGADGCLWFGLGVLLGPIGFALAFTTGTKCPKCASRVSKDAMICPNCGQTLRGNPTPQVAESPSAPSEPTKQCPFCAEKILAAAIKCRFCGEFLPAPAQSAQPVNMQAAQFTETISNTLSAVDLKAEGAEPARKADTDPWLTWIVIGVLAAIAAVIFIATVGKGAPVSKSPEVGPLHCVSARVESRWHLEHSPAWRITDTQISACELAGKDLYRITGESKSRGRFVCLARDTGKADWDISCTPADGEGRK
jgi:hypothetical protein